MQQDWRTSPSGSGGLVVRRGAAMALIRDEGTQDDELVTALLQALETAADDAEPGRRLARQFAGLVSRSEPEDVPDLCLVAATDGGGVAAFLVGDAELTIDSGTGVEERVSGRDVATWVDRILRPPLHRLGAALGGVPAPTSSASRTDLRDGIVPGGAVLLEMTGACPPAPAAEPAAETATAAAAVPQAPPAERSASAPAPTVDEPVQGDHGDDGGGGAAPSHDPDPEPTALGRVDAPTAPVDPPSAPVPSVPSQSPRTPAQAPAVAASTGTSSRSTFTSVSLSQPLAEEELVPLPSTKDEADVVQVLGISCSRGHFNDPHSVYCASCGISLVHQTHNLVPGPRPTLGVLVVDDGGVFTLNHDYVLGREPGNAEAVMEGKAVPLPLDDPDLTLSRVHAAVLRQDWSVRVVDLGSANGTFVQRHADDEWIRLTPHEPMTLQTGAKIRVGNRTVGFDSHRKS